MSKLGREVILGLKAQNLGDERVLVAKLKGQVDSFGPPSWHSLTRIANKVSGVLCGLKDIQPKLGAQRARSIFIREST